MTLKAFTYRIGRRALVLCLAAGIAVVANACGGSPVGPSENPNLALRLTDAMTDDVEKVNIYFTSVTVKPAGQPVQELALQLTENPIDLLTLRDKTVSFAAGVVAPGEYEFIHINLAGAQSSIVEKGVEKSLLVPSEEIKIVGGLTVAQDGQTTVTLDFDAAQSLIRLGSGEWLLKPVVLVTRIDQTR